MDYLKEALALVEEPYRDAVLIAAEAFVVLVAAFLLTTVLGLVFRFVEALPGVRRYRKVVRFFRKIVLAIAILGGVAAMAAVVAVNGYQLYLGNDLLAYSESWVVTVPADFWKKLGVGLAKAAGIFIAIGVAIRIVRRILRGLAERAKAWGQLKRNDAAVKAFFSAIDRMQSIGLWLLAVVLAAQVLPLPDAAAAYAFIVLKIYLIVEGALLVSKTVALIIDSLDALNEKYASRSLLAYYNRLRMLIPLLRRCLEYITYVFAATLVLLQLDFVAKFAEWGPRIVQAIGIFFLSRVVAELCVLMVDGYFQRQSRASDGDEQRRLTVMPMIRSSVKSVVYFIAFTLILDALTINPLPILAGAGILGIVVGLGAQPLINDVVAGFMILFEGLYMVGDFIETGSARGTVELLTIRTTRIRDPDGQLHVLRNGQINNVTNYSREYTHAVVHVTVAPYSDFQHIEKILVEAGEALRRENEFVMEPTRVDGVDRLDGSELVVRTTTRVKPGKHLSVARAYRRLIKEAFERGGVDLPTPQTVVILKRPEDAPVSASPELAQATPDSPAASTV